MSIKVTDTSTGISKMPMVRGDVVHEAKDRALHLIWDGGPLSPRHTVVYIDLPRGDPFILDVTSLQYGWEEQLYTWQVYETHRVRILYSVGPLGSKAALEDSLLANHPPDDSVNASRVFRTGLLRGMISEMESFLGACGVHLHGLLSAKHPDYMPAREDLVSAVKRRLYEDLRRLDERGVTRMYWNDQFMKRAAMSEEKVKELERVWMSHEEFEARRGDARELLRKYNENRQRARLETWSL